MGDYRPCINKLIKVKYIFHKWIVVNCGVYALVENPNGKIDRVRYDQIQFLDSDKYFAESPSHRYYFNKIDKGE